jgi:hypothetical protein
LRIFKWREKLAIGTFDTKIHGAAVLSTDAEPLAPIDITRRRFCEASIAMMSSGLLPTDALAALADPVSSHPASAPSLDELETEWLDCGQLAHMPSMHNFHQMAACAPDLAGVNFLPGRRLYKNSGPRWFIYNTLPICRVSINGQSPDASECRWSAYQATRRATSDDVEIVTTNRLASELNAVLWRLRLHNKGKLPKTVDLSVFWKGSVQPDGGARFHDTGQAMDSVYQFFDGARVSQAAGDPEEIESHWEMHLQPGTTQEIRFQMCVNTRSEDLLEAETGQPAWFESQWSRAKTVWDERWNAAFTPGNRFFSGNAPLLVTGDAAIREIYYRSVLTLLVLLRTNTWSDRTFITSGERGNIVYYWDTSLFSTLFALLEPKQMKEQVKFFLEQDPHKGADLGFGPQRPATPAKLIVADGWDLHGYAANDVSIFRLAHSYLSVTQDPEFLSERIADQTVLERLRVLATGWKKLLRNPSDQLADYGGAGNLLECVPTYIDQVPSFNAANVWMMRELAAIQKISGQSAEPSNLRAEADTMVKAVMGLYVPGQGVWCSLHRDGTRVEMRHCYDFASIGRFMPGDLPASVRNEMVAFVQRELLTDKWMRAQSLLDVAAASSDRPDHGPMGAYDAWPAVTIDAMCNLGHWQDGVAFLRRTQAAIYEGVYAQARELFGPDKLNIHASVRIAQRRGCMRECCGGGAFAETVITTLFGFRPRLGGKPEIFEPKVSRGFKGELRHVRYGRAMYTVQSGSSGLILRKEGGYV